MEVPPTPQAAACWSSIVKYQPEPPPKSDHLASHPHRVVERCNSSKGVSIAVVDANAVIHGGQTLSNSADRFVSVAEVIREIRDPVSRHSLAFLPFPIDTMEPSPESLKKVINFARATGDLQTLSDVDLKLIALTYMLEAQIHGIEHLRDTPPPVNTVNVKRLPEKDMPGWGTNVPNLEEWEALEHEAEGGSNSTSRILPLKDINLNVVPTEDQLSSGDVSMGTTSEAHAEDEEDAGISLRKPRRYLPKKREVKTEGKKMVADGVDASQGQYQNNGDDWMPAVSRSTQRRYMRRKARREMFELLSQKDGSEDVQNDMADNVLEETTCSEQLMRESSEETHVVNELPEEIQTQEGNGGDEDLSSVLQQMSLEEDSLKTLQEGERSMSYEGLASENSTAMTVTFDQNANGVVERDEVQLVSEELDQLEISSQTCESVEASYVDDDSSEQSWMLRSLSDSSVACVTSDFAMQNVILQMGLRLLAPGGMQIRQLHRWILKCHACYTVTAEIGRIFCPACGNGGTLRKVAVTVGENGVVVAARRPRITLRGTKFSLPLPQGGRDAIAKNPVLREDQLSHKLLYPKRKKKVNKQGEDIFTSDYIFCHHTDKKAPLKPPIGKALAVFSGRRNPNDNHFSRAKH